MFAFSDDQQSQSPRPLSGQMPLGMLNQNGDASQRSVSLSSQFETSLGNVSRLNLAIQPAIRQKNLPRETRQLVWFGGIGRSQEESGKPYYSIDVLQLVSKRYNANLLHACGDNRVECIDSAPLIPTTPHVATNCISIKKVHYIVGKLKSEYLMDRELGDLSTGKVQQAHSHPLEHDYT